MTDEDLKRWKEMAELAAELDRLAAKQPWIDGIDFVSFLDQGEVAAMRAHDEQFARHTLRMSEAEIVDYLTGTTRHYGGGGLVCESVSPSNLVFITEARRIVPELGRAVRAMLEERERLNGRIDAMKDDVGKLSIELEEWRDRDNICGESGYCPDCGEKKVTVADLESELERVRAAERLAKDGFERQAIKYAECREERDAALEMAQVERAVCAEATSCHGCVRGDGSSIIEELRAELAAAYSNIEGMRTRLVEAGLW